ncbi:MAG: hypothetical protein L0Z50_18110, partial [Verrucomicrobiales bacterium]|nr:hypothetical protein [Verrucomicrobiales bacterium]
MRGEGLLFAVVAGAQGNALLAEGLQTLLVLRLAVALQGVLHAGKAGKRADRAAEKTFPVLQDAAGFVGVGGVERMALLIVARAHGGKMPVQKAAHFRRRNLPKIDAVIGLGAGRRLRIEALVMADGAEAVFGPAADLVIAHEPARLVHLEFFTGREQREIVLGEPSAGLGQQVLQEEPAL